MRSTQFLLGTLIAEWKVIMFNIREWNTGNWFIFGMLMMVALFLWPIGKRIYHYASGEPTRAELQVEVGKQKQTVTQLAQVQKSNEQTQAVKEAIAEDQSDIKADLKTTTIQKTKQSRERRQAFEEVVKKTSDVPVTDTVAIETPEDAVLASAMYDLLDRSYQQATEPLYEPEHTEQQSSVAETIFVSALDNGFESE